MASKNDGGKISFAFSGNRKRKNPMAVMGAAEGFETKAQQGVNPPSEHSNNNDSSTPLVIPLQDKDKRTLLERKLAIVVKTEHQQQKEQQEDDLAAIQALEQSAANNKNDNNSNHHQDTNFSAKGDYVISSGPNTNLTLEQQQQNNNSKNHQHVNEKEQYLQELKALPDAEGVESDSYRKVPIHQFGAALLRGMGWKGGESSSSTNMPATARPHRLGLGATPKLMTATSGGSGKKIRTEAQVQRDKKLQQQQEHYDSERQERVRQDKQQTLQVNSIVWIESDNDGNHQQRRAKVMKLSGVPGLNRVLVQFEGSQKATSIRKGELGELVSRPNLFDQPFEEVAIKDDTQQQPKFMGLSNQQQQEEDRHDKNSRKRRRDDEDASGVERTKKSHKHEKQNRKSRDNDKNNWIIPNIRVRIITKKLGSQYYKEKGTVVDVTERGYATLNLGRQVVLDRIPERYLETALPKVGGNVIVLVTSSKEQSSKYAKGKLLERKSGKGVMQVFDDLRVLSMPLDDMAEWVGPLDDDMME